MARVDIPDYTYVNARVRAMRAHLLTRDFFMRLVEAEDFNAIHSLLDQSIYRREINEALVLNPEKPRYDYALSKNLYAALMKIYNSVGGKPRRLVEILYSRYDVDNIKAVIRGKKGDATPSEIMEIVVPVGNLRKETLGEMARAREILDVINVMRAHGAKYATPLESHYERFVRQNRDVSVLELALDKFHFQDAISRLEGKDPNVALTRQILRSEIDIRNISTLVRIRGFKLEDNEVLNLVIPGGTLEPKDFLYLQRLGDLSEIVSEYPDPRFKEVLEKALGEYQEKDIVAFDQELYHELIREGVGMSNVDVLGIGVIIGYMWAKQCEIMNLRIILKGKELGRADVDIKSDLFFVEPVAQEVH
ncbi:MAG: V-type ATPase subunit [Actinomycetota bacterium]|nr:V-type ATPase subunit [Actinomycetota bacterium]